MIPMPYRITEVVKRIRIQIDKDYPDPREQPVENHDPCPLIETAYSRRYHRAKQRADRARDLEIIMERDQALFAAKFLELHEDDPELRYALQGRAAVRAALLLWHRPFEGQA